MDKRELPESKRRALAYQLFNGFTDVDTAKGPLSKEQSQIAFIVERIYQHRINLCARGNLDFEDKDLEAIISAYEQLNRLCAYLMYDQGWYDAQRISEP